MANFFKHFPSSPASRPLHRLVTAKLSPPPFAHSSLIYLKLSLFSTSIAAANGSPKNNHHLQAEKTHTHSQQYTPIEKLLLNECGLSQSELSSVIRRTGTLLGRRSTQTAQQAVQVFRDSGFTRDQVRKIIIRSPTAICLRADRQLKPKLELMQTQFGLTGEHLGDVVCQSPRSLSCSLEKTLSPTAQYLQSLFASKARLTMAVKRAPWLPQCNVERQLKPKVDLLQHYGFEGELLVLLLLRSPRILSRSTDSLKLKIDSVRDMGISQSSKRFSVALNALTNSGPEILKKKLNHLASFGLLEDEIKELLRKYPNLLNVSIDKMQKTRDFLIHTAGLPKNFMLTYPALFTYSLESRIKPRHAVLKFISAMQLHKPIPSLEYIVMLGEQKFLDKYVKDSPYAIRLSEIYSGKSVDLDII